MPAIKSCQYSGVDGSPLSSRNREAGIIANPKAAEAGAKDARTTGSLVVFYPGKLVTHVLSRVRRAESVSVHWIDEGRDCFTAAVGNSK